MTTNFTFTSLSTVDTGIEYVNSTIDALATRTSSSNIATTTATRLLSSDGQTVVIVGIVVGFCLIVISAILLLVCLYFCRNKKEKLIRYTRSHLLPDRKLSISDPKTTIDRGMKKEELPYWVSKVDDLFLKTYNPYYHNYTYYGQGVRSNRPFKNVTNEP